VSDNYLPVLLDSFTLHLRAERKSPQTVKTYPDGVRSFLSWCARSGVEPALDRPTVTKLTASLLDGGAEPATARSRQLAVRRFSAWLADEGEIPADQPPGSVSAGRSARARPGPFNGPLRDPGMPIHVVQAAARAPRLVQGLPAL